MTMEWNGFVMPPVALHVIGIQSMRTGMDRGSKKLIFIFKLKSFMDVPLTFCYCPVTESFKTYDDV